MQFEQIIHLSIQKVKKSPLVLLLFLALILITACSNTLANPDPDLGTSAAGEITVYTSILELQARKYVTVFETQYPNIKVNLVRAPGSAIIQRLLDEQDNPQADVVWVFINTLC